MLYEPITRDHKSFLSLHVHMRNETIEKHHTVNRGTLIELISVINCSFFINDNNLI